MMHTDARTARFRKALVVLLFSFGLMAVGLPAQDSAAKSLLGHDPGYQTAALLYDEARTVYLGNLARRDSGVPPLRWNLEMTHAARWFSWDSVENRPGGYCGHTDTLGMDPWDRTDYFEYTGGAGGENAFCGYVTPEDAIQGWLNSPGHRSNLLDPGWIEIGLGYYRRPSDERGYVAQVFGGDYAYGPVIVENEAVNTISPSVGLYIYDRVPDEGGYTGWGGAAQMMVSNNPQFSGAVWEPFRSEKTWTLEGGSGWRTVYVKTRDSLDRTMIVSDKIYLGASVPLDELGSQLMAGKHAKVILNGLNGGSLPLVQFSQTWIADAVPYTFSVWRGNAESVNDAAAWGGSAYRLSPGGGETYGVMSDLSLPMGTSYVAYFRLKVNNNTSSAEVARISVKDVNDVEYGPISLRGTDFKAPNQYQEFAVNFKSPVTEPYNAFVLFTIARGGSADVYMDAVTIFSPPQPLASPTIWSVPGGRYRGRGIWVRYTDGTRFSALSEAPWIELPTPTFADVADAHWAWEFIERLYDAGITGGCGTNPPRYCPEGSVTRGQMAVFLLRGIHGSAYTPPAVGGGTGFGDVPPSYWSAPFIKQLAAEGITAGCGSGNYCPEAPVNRGQMAVFLLRSKYGAGYTPPAVGSSTGFGDVPANHWAAPFIKQLVAEGITAGCGGGNYCPEAPVTRAQMAVFLVRTFNLP